MPVIREVSAQFRRRSERRNAPTLELRAALTAVAGSALARNASGGRGRVSSAGHSRSRLRRTAARRAVSDEHKRGRERRAGPHLAGLRDARDGPVATPTVPSTQRLVRRRHDTRWGRLLYALGPQPTRNGHFARPLALDPSGVVCVAEPLPAGNERAAAPKRRSRCVTTRRSFAAPSAKTRQAMNVTERPPLRSRSLDQRSPARAADARADWPVVRPHPSAHSEDPALRGGGHRRRARGAAGAQPLVASTRS